MISRLSNVEVTDDPETNSLRTGWGEGGVLELEKRDWTRAHAKLSRVFDKKGWRD